jgi:acyl-lipid omega-6 desaturase (Delta-12 desaturase)
MKCNDVVELETGTVDVRHPANMDQIEIKGSLTDQTAARALRRAVMAFESPQPLRSFVQIVTSFGPFLAICAARYAWPDMPIWLIALTTLLAGGFVVRIFIIQHDCGHGSFFGRRWANDLLGHICSLFTFTPYAHWRRQHAGHHASWNNLDRRANVDLYSNCLTLEEYRALSPLRRFTTRLVRHPLFSLILLPPCVFLLLYRVPFDSPKGWERERRNVHLTNLALLVMIVALGLVFGFVQVALVQLPILVVSSIVGVWLFSVQHRFETTLWRDNPAWSAFDASLQGSSYLKLPRILQFFTGNIGFHHVHHLSPRVPNYRLEACHDALPQLHAAPVLNLRMGLMNWRWALWDEAAQRMVPFSAAWKITNAGNENGGPESPPFNAAISDA